MKLILRMIIGLAIVAIGILLYWLYLNSHPITLAVFEVPSSQDGENTSHYTDDINFLKKVATMVESASSTEDLPSLHSPIFSLTTVLKDQTSTRYDIYYVKGQKTDEYYLYNHTSGLYEEIHNERAEAVILTDSFPLYADYYAPKLDLRLGEEDLDLPPVAYEWTYSRLEIENHTIQKQYNNEALPFFESSDGLAVFEMDAFAAANHLEDFDIRIEKDDALYWTGSGADLSGYTPPQNGTYIFWLDVKIEDQNLPYEGRATFAFEIEFQRPVMFFLDDSTASQGDLRLLYGRFVEEGDTLSCTMPWGDEAVFYPQSDGSHLALIPIDLALTEGIYHLTCTATTSGEDGTVTEEPQEIPLTVIDGGFDSYTLSSESSKALDSTKEEAQVELSAKIEPLFDAYDTPLSLAGPLLSPVPWKLNSDFGLYLLSDRSDNVYRNAGIDLGARGGVDVNAAMAGTVVFADNLITSGNTIIIDHGYGIRTHYHHLSTILISEGDFVTVESVIGEVGMTGIATGNHLHFGLSANGVYIDPTPYFERPIIPE